MKSKKFTYVLIVSVAAVWGIIFYKLLMASDAGSVPSLLSNARAAEDPWPENYQLQDTFTLALNYRDPFSGEQLKKEPPLAVPGNSPHVPAAPVPRNVVNRESVKYGGYIVNPSTKRIVSIVTVEGREQMMSEGELNNGLTLIKNHRDSVKVAYHGLTYFVRKTN